MAKQPAKLTQQPGPVGRFMEFTMQGYNSATLVEAAQAWVRLLEDDGDMFVAVAGAASTGQIGRTLARLIRERKVCGIGCTGANLEEDPFNLVGFNAYEYLPKYGMMTTNEDSKLGMSGHPRVTDATIPEKEAMQPVCDALCVEWKKADVSGERLFPYQFMYRVLLSGVLKDAIKKHEGHPEWSWMLAAAEMNLPIFTPGWEDSTTGNCYAGLRARGEIMGRPVKDGTEWFEEMGNWYRTASKQSSGIGFFQIGGGIAGDGPICVVPYLLTDMKEEDTKFWSYFAQITDAHVSYGGYSGASPTEKVSWLKLSPDGPMFDIHSDASICFPLVAAYVLGD
jgi:deoxyhypusine synthase